MSEENNVINVDFEKDAAADEVEVLRRNQFQNKFITDRKDTFVSICNKVLDYCYDAKDRNEIKSELSSEALDNIDSILEDLESIRKKIQIEALLADEEITRIILCCQLLAREFMANAENYIQGANSLNGYIEFLLEKNLTSEE